MGNILGKIRKKVLRFCMDIYYKALVWVIFWGKFKKIVYVSVWSCTIRL
jgi:hypothetical protein